VSVVGFHTVALASESDFVYKNNGDGTATITDYTRPGGSIEIPSTLGLTVVEMATMPFPLALVYTDGNEIPKIEVDRKKDTSPFVGKRLACPVGYSA